MGNFADPSPPPASGESLIFRIAAIALAIGCLELIVRKFKCELGEFVSLFWINFILLFFLFYWPIYLAKKFNGIAINSFRNRFGLFFKTLLKVAFYLLVTAILMVFTLSFVGIGVSDSLVFLPLIFIWPLYVWWELRQEIRKVIRPLVIGIVTLLAVQLFNTPNPTLGTFDRHFKSFQEVAMMVRSGELKPESQNGSYSTIKLPCKYRYLVSCPNRRITVKQQGNTTEIFFCVDRSRFANEVTGFVYRSDAKDFSNAEVRQLKDHWFWQKTSK